MANLRAAIEHAGTALVSVGTGLPAGDLVNIGRALFGRDGPKKLKSLARSVQRSLTDEIEREFGGVAETPLLATLTDLLQHHARSLGDVIEQHGMQEARVAAAIMKDGEQLLIDLDFSERSLLFKLLKGTYRNYLAQRELLHELSLIALPTLFDHQTRNQAEFQRIRLELERLKTVDPPTIPFTIPPPVADFKGYDDERAVVREVLAGGGTVAISALHGIGGAGKSELALKVAEELAADFPDGQILVDMLGTKPKPLDADEAMTVVLRALGAKEIDPRTRAADYQSWLRGKRLLIVLDNAASAHGLDQLRPPAPVALLVTSRTRLHIGGVQPIELVHLSRAAAKALLAGILPDVADANLDALAERCADLPLALRVAGAYLQETGASPEAFLEALKERRLAHLARCAGDMKLPDLDPLQVLGLSYDRLAETDPDLARSFTRLAVFPADFDSVAAAAVLDLGQDDAERHLGLLYRRNLVQRPSEGRLRLHDLLRELAAAKLTIEEERSTLQIFEDYFLEFLNNYNVIEWASLQARRSFSTGMEKVNPDLFIELANISYAIALSLVHNMSVARNALEKLFSAGSASLSPMSSPISDVLQTMERAIASLRAEDRDLALARTLAMLGGRDPGRHLQMRGGSQSWSKSAITTRAIELFHRLTPMNPAYKVELAVCLTQNDRLAEAAMEYADLARIDRANFEEALFESVRRYAGSIVRALLTGKGQLNHVTVDFQQLLERAPSSSLPWLADRMSTLASLAESDRCKADPGSLADDLRSLSEKAQRTPIFDDKVSAKEDT